MAELVGDIAGVASRLPPPPMKKPPKMRYSPGAFLLTAEMSGEQRVTTMALRSSLICGTKPVSSGGKLGGIAAALPGSEKAEAPAAASGLLSFWGELGSSPSAGSGEPASLERGVCSCRGRVASQ